MNTTQETSIKATKIAMPVCSKALNQWGYVAFARHCARIGVSFDDAYYMIFGKEPRTVLVQTDVLVTRSQGQ
jgi:hypothetical protein